MVLLMKMGVYEFHLLHDRNESRVDKGGIMMENICDHNLHNEISVFLSVVE